MPGAPAVAVVSFGMWQRDFGSDADIVGKTLSLGWGEYTVIGVMPREFRWSGCVSTGEQPVTTG